MRKIIVVFIAVLFIIGLVGYIYFDRKFTPPENQLNVSGQEDTVAISWVSNHDTDYAALLLPVKVAGLSQVFYMQFDLGAHTTLFYDKALQSIHHKYPQVYFGEENRRDSLSFRLGAISIATPKINRINYGKEINWDLSAINIIGTLGSDILEHKVVLMNLKEHFVHFGNSFPTAVDEESIQDFEFKKRKVLLNAKINDEATQLYYDSGSSAFQLITDKDSWLKLGTEGATEKVYQANSWRKPLEVHNIASDAIVRFAYVEIPIDEVTYIEGISVMQNILMHFSGMGGMIGNKLFLGKTIVLDGENQKFAVIE